jgi:hypothetical protein
LTIQNEILPINPFIFSSLLLQPVGYPFFISIAKESGRCKVSIQILSNQDLSISFLLLSYSSSNYIFFNSLKNIWMALKQGFYPFEKSFFTRFSKPLYRFCDFCSIPRITL